jgi:hypothetical protein
MKQPTGDSPPFTKIRAALKTFWSSSRRPNHHDEKFLLTIASVGSVVGDRPWLDQHRNRTTEKSKRAM